jgi:hypothetical protein
MYEPDPRKPVRTLSGLIFSAFVLVLVLLLIVKILEAIWLPLLIICGSAAVIATGVWIVGMNRRRW